MSKSRITSNIVLQGPNSSQSSNEAGKLLRPNSIRPALSLLLATSFLSATVAAPASHAADFSRAKRVIVPASAIERHQDHDMGTYTSGSYAPTYGNYSTYSGTTYRLSPQGSGYTSDSSTSGTTSKGSSSGLVPPPPPIAPSILPPELLAPTLSGNFGGLSPSSGTTSYSSSSTGKTFQQITADPVNRRGIERHTSASAGNQHNAESARISQAVARSRRLVNEGHLAEAQSMLEKYEKWHPENNQIKSALANVSIARAKYYVRQDDLVAGAEHARTALYYDHDNKLAKDLLTQSLKQQGLDPGNLSTRLKQAHTLFSQGKLKEANVEYGQANAIRETATGHVGLGNIALRNGDQQSASREYHLALEKNPKSGAAHRQMGALKYLQNDLVGANSELSSALILNSKDSHAAKLLTDLWQRQVQAKPNDANAHMGLARTYQLAGDMQSAQSEYRTVVRIDPNHPGLPAARESFKLALSHQEALSAFTAARNLESTGAVKEAFARAGEAADKSPSYVPFRLYQAGLAEKLGYRADAKNLYLMVLRQDPGNTIAAQRISALSAALTQEPGIAPMMATAGRLSDYPVQSQMPPLGISNPVGEEPPLAYLPGPSGAGVAAASGAIGTALAAGAAGKISPGPTHDPVTNMTGFLASLRNHMLTQEKQLKKYEDNMMVTLGKERPPRDDSGSDFGGSPPLPGASGLLAGAALPGSTTETAPVPKVEKGSLITSSDIKNILAGGSAPTPASIPTAPSLAPLAAPTASSVSSSAPAFQTPSSLSAGADEAIATAPQALGIRPDEVITRDAVPLGSGLPDLSTISSAVAQSGTTLQNAAKSLASDPRVQELANQAKDQIGVASEAIKQKLSTVTEQDMDNFYQSVKKPIASKLGIKTAPPSTAPGVIAAKAPVVAPAPNRIGSAAAAASDNAASVVSETSSVPSASKVLETGATSIQGIDTAAAGNGIVANASKKTLPLRPPLATDANADADRAARALVMDKNQDKKTIASLSSPGTHAKQVESLKKQNEQLQSELDKMRQQMKKIKKAKVDKTASTSNGTVNSSTVADAKEDLKASAPIQAAGWNGASQAANNLSKVAESIASSDNTRLDLLGMEVKKNGVRLNVMLRNNSGKQIELPRSMKAVVRRSGMSDQTVEISLAGKRVNAGGEMRGYISIPGSQIDPTADILIPDIMSGANLKGDIHLTVPVSMLASKGS